MTGTVNGKENDHPLTDILIYNLEVYGTEADDLIRRISELSSPRELDEWWAREIGWSAEPHDVLGKARRRFQELRQRARDSGWESP